MDLAVEPKFLQICVSIIFITTTIFPLLILIIIIVTQTLNGSSLICTEQHGIRSSNSTSLTYLEKKLSFLNSVYCDFKFRTEVLLGFEMMGLFFTEYQEVR